MKKYINVCIGIFLFSLTVYSTSFAGNNIEDVQNGQLQNYAQVPIKQILNARFDNNEWEEFKTDIGETIVQFNGRISEKLKARYLEIAKKDYQALDQFTLSVLGSQSIVKLTDDERNSIITKFKNLENTPEYERLIALEVLMVDHSNEFFHVGTPAAIKWLVNSSNGGFKLIDAKSNAWMHLTTKATVWELIFGN